VAEFWAPAEILNRISGISKEHCSGRTTDCNDVLIKTALDLGRASQARIVLDPALFPLARSAAVAAELLGTAAAEFALRGVSGDNRLLFTCAPEDLPRLVRHTGQTLGRSPFVVGSVAHGSGVTLVGSDGLEAVPPSTEVVYREGFTAGNRPLSLAEFPPRGRALNQI
jgi:thiamine monophosphate kinase